MTEQPTPTQIKAFLDDLARISARHGIKVAVWPGGVSVDPIEEGFRGYECWGRQREISEIDGPQRGELIRSLDLTQLSNHERIQILGGRGLGATLAEMEPLDDEDAMPDVDESDFARLMTDAELKTLVRLDGMRTDDWGGRAALFDWLTRPNRSIGGARPCDRLAEDADEIVASFRAEISEPMNG